LVFSFFFWLSFLCSPDLRPLPHPALRRKSKRILNYWHWAGVSPYTSSFDLAGTCVFVKQSLSVFCCKSGFHRTRTSPKGYVQLSLPSSLRIVLPIAFVYSTRPPVSVYGTVKIVLLHESFLGNRKIADLRIHNSHKRKNVFDNLHLLAI